jgi:hypothetical protein
MWHFCYPPPPLKCNVLFEWPQTTFFGLLKFDQMTQKKEQGSKKEIGMSFKKLFKIT